MAGDTNAERLTPLKARDCAYLLRGLCPQRFFEFVDKALNIEEEGDRPEVLFVDAGYRFYRYDRWKPNRRQTGMQVVNCYLVTHHVPSLVEHLNFFNLYESDLTHASHFKSIVDAFREVYSLKPHAMFKMGDGSFCYVTNCFCLDEYNRDVKPFLAQMEECAARSGFSDSRYRTPVNISDPLSLFDHFRHEPCVASELLALLSRMDAFGISVSSSNICVLPYQTCDIVGVSEPNVRTFTFNVNCAGAAAPYVQTLYELQEIIQHCPGEERIDTFLRDGFHHLFEPDYRSIRAKVVIAPSGEKPDFFLEARDGLWETLELKRPIDNRTLLNVVDQEGKVRLGAYLLESLEQCQKYLRILERKETRERLCRMEGITYDEPRIILLIGRQQYPEEVQQMVADRYDRRILVQSFEELFEQSVARKEHLLRELTNLRAVKS